MYLQVNCGTFEWEVYRYSHSLYDYKLCILLFSPISLLSNGIILAIIVSTGGAFVGEADIVEAIIGDGCNASDPILCKYSKFYCQSGFINISIIILMYSVYSIN